MGGAIPLSGPVERDCRSIQGGALHSRKDCPGNPPTSRMAQAAKATRRCPSRHTHYGYLTSPELPNAGGERSKRKLAQFREANTKNGNKTFCLLPFIISNLQSGSVRLVV